MLHCIRIKLAFKFFQKKIFSNPISISIICLFFTGLNLDMHLFISSVQNFYTNARNEIIPCDVMLLYLTDISNCSDSHITAQNFHESEARRKKHYFKNREGKIFYILWVENQV